MPHAIRMHQTGGPEVLQWETADVGEPGPGQARVRHFEPESAENQIVVEKNVQVERARAVDGAPGAVAAEVEFKGEQSVQQRAWREPGFKRDHGVHEAGLIGEADGRG